MEPAKAAKRDATLIIPNPKAKGSDSKVQRAAHAFIAA